jgi:hypothetical protein
MGITRGRANKNIETTMLTTFISVCAWCKKSLGFKSHAGKVGEYFAFTHGACSECMEKAIKELDD